MKALMILSGGFYPNTFLFLVLFFVTFLPVRALPENIYYKNENGVKHYTNLKPADRGFVKVKSKWVESSYNEPSGPAHLLGSLQYSDRYDDYINTASRIYNLDPDLIKAMIKVESDFYHRAVSPKGAMGVMQLMPETAENVGVRRPFDPSENIMGGSKYLRKLMDMFNGNKTLALAGYNAGENAVIKYGYSVPPYRETQEYVKKVLRHYHRLKNSEHSVATTAVAKNMESPEQKNNQDREVSSVSYKESISPDGSEFVRKTKKSKVIVESVKYVDVGSSPARKSLKTKRTELVNDGDYTVQVASFSEIDSAKELENSLKSKTYPAYIKVAQIPGKGTWYRVRVGEFNTKNDAMSYAEYLKTEQPYINSAFVTAN